MKEAGKSAFLNVMMNENVFKMKHPNTQAFWQLSYVGLS